MKKTIAASWILCVSILAAVAQNVPPALFVSGAEKSLTLAVTKLAVDVRIHGSVSETRMTMTFHNPSDRSVAGDLYFPLPQGATVTGFALDIGGTMVDGVPVETQKARQVFEKVVRQGVDPGLAEWTRGSNFHTRVFPIPPRGTRTVMVRFLSGLAGSREAPLYVLPLRFRERIQDAFIRVVAVRPGAAPSVRDGAAPGFSFRRDGSDYVAEASWSGVPLDRDLAIDLPRADNNRGVLVERDRKGSYWFAIDVPVTAPADRSVPAAPRRIALYWDASLSRSMTVGRTLRFLTEYFSRLPGAAVQVDLTVFRNEAEPARTFTVRGGNVKELVTALQGLAYDGGTQLGCYPAAPAGTDLAFLCTDGISDFGPADLSASGVPLYTVSEGPTADHRLLRYLALKNSGEYFNLDAMDPAAAARRVGAEVYGFLGTQVTRGQADDVYPRTAQPVGESFRVIGRLPVRNATVTVRFGVSGKADKELAFDVSRDDAGDGDLLSLLWAQERIDDLLVFPDRNASLIEDTGKEFGLVTPGTSLLVLDSLEQYVANRIAPPESLPAMRAAYLAALDRQEKDRLQGQARKIDRVLALWNERVAWWNTEFTYPKNLRVVDADKKEAAGAGAPSPERASAAMPAPAAAPAFAVPEQAEMAKMADAQPPKPDAAGEPAPEPEPEISIKAWNPDTPYLAALRKGARGSWYDIYLAQRGEYGSSPAFFLDCADFFHENGIPDLGLRILSNLAELRLQDPALLRILAHRLDQLGNPLLAAWVFEEVLRMRPEEPQSCRDLALVLGKLGDFERAISLLYEVVLGSWDRFGGIETIALMELNAMIPKARAAGRNVPPVDPRLVKLLDVDVRIVLTWDADMTDMDLWVIEPSGEKAYYGNQRTRIGGNVSNDFTDGYGPEEYAVRRAMKGKYAVQVDYFSNQAPSLSGSVTLQADVFTNYGRPNEKLKSITVRLRDNTETLDIGEIGF